MKLITLFILFCALGVITEVELQRATTIHIPGDHYDTLDGAVIKADTTFVLPNSYYDIGAYTMDSLHSKIKFR